MLERPLALQNENHFAGTMGSPPRGDVRGDSRRPARYEAAAKEVNPFWQQEIEVHHPLIQQSGSPPQRSVPEDAAMKWAAAQAARCKVHGSGVVAATVREPAKFTIDVSGSRSGEDTKAHLRTNAAVYPFVTVRGVSRVHAHVTANGDDTYSVEWRPTLSGHYQIVIRSHLGMQLPGSPFEVSATTPEPHALKSTLSGEALNNAVAHKAQSFSVSFRDKLGAVTQYVRHAGGMGLTHALSSWREGLLVAWSTQWPSLLIPPPVRMPPSQCGGTRRVCRASAARQSSVARLTQNKETRQGMPLPCSRTLIDVQQYSHVHPSPKQPTRWLDKL